jgi:soluble lytic murein transglycosylase-like protein
MVLKSEVRALWARHRHSMMKYAVGGALMIPAATMMAGGHLDSLYEATESGRVASDNNAGYPQFETDEVARAWSERMQAREQELVVTSFAREYRIPVPLAGSIHKAALEAKIPPKMAFGLVQAESSFRTRAVSPVGAVGLTQVMPATARWLVPGTTRGDLMNTDTNLRIGFTYLRRLLDQYDGDEMLALTAYNRGPGTVARVMRQGRDPDNGYADKVLTGESEKHVRLMNARFGPGARRGR